MNQSRILGNLQMTHSQYIDDDDQRQKKLEEKEDEELYKTMANLARKSYIANKKKGKQQEVKVEDVKPHKKNKIFNQKTGSIAPDLSVSKLPNYNVLKIQNVSNNTENCWLCHVFPHKKQLQCQLFFENTCRLMIYEKSTLKLQYTFNFDTVDVELQQKFSLSEQNQFLLVVNPIILKFSHQSAKILQSWYSQLKKIIDKSYGKQFKMNEIALKDPQSFYKKLYCTEDQFSSNCETGDILLFEDEHFFAKAQRFILNADYDHVAMIIRDKKYGILMFEANSMSGVSLTPWNCMIKYGWFKYIKRIVWRKLQNVERSKFFQGIIHKFVKENLKANYFISFDKLLSNKSYIGQKEQQKGFFCSQLIAKIYKDLQILTRDTTKQGYMASNKIYPYHFSEKFDLKLQTGNLSKEYEIHFNDQMLKKQYGEDFIQS